MHAKSIKSWLKFTRMNILHLAMQQWHN